MLHSRSKFQEEFEILEQFESKLVRLLRVYLVGEFLLSSMLDVDMELHSNLQVCVGVDLVREGSLLTRRAYSYFSSYGNHVPDFNKLTIERTNERKWKQCETENFKLDQGTMLLFWKAILRKLAL